MTGVEAEHGIETLCSGSGRRKAGGGGTRGVRGIRRAKGLHPAHTPGRTQPTVCTPPRALSFCRAQRTGHTHASTTRHSDARYGKLSTHGKLTRARTRMATHSTQRAGLRHAAASAEARARVLTWVGTAVSQWW